LLQVAVAVPLVSQWHQVKVVEQAVLEDQLVVEAVEPIG
jgi:hypothetical protein